MEPSGIAAGCLRRFSCRRSLTSAAPHTPLKTGPVFRDCPVPDCGALFVTCMTCHGELVRLKPRGPSKLTTFYLSIAFGGALGGLAIAVLAPRFFNANYEYPIVITAAAAVLLIPFWRDRKTWRYPQAGMAIWLGAAASCVVLSTYATMQFAGESTRSAAFGS